MRTRRTRSGAALSLLLGAAAWWSVAACSPPGGGGGGYAGSGGGGGGGGDAGVVFDVPPAVDVVTPDAVELVRCKDDSECPAEQPHCSLSGFCFECTDDGHCADGEVCKDGYCVPQSCAPGEKLCAGNAVLTCNAGGDGWDRFECPAGVCVDGACAGCPPGFRSCDKMQVVECRPDGSGFDPVETCQIQCFDGVCVDCAPGKLQCNGNIVERCLEGGGWEVAEDCNASGKNCVAGFCVSACVVDPKFASNSGCDYWAVDLDNHPSAQNSPFAVVVANLSDKATDVTVVAKPSADATSVLAAEAEVPPGALHIFDLPQRNMGLPGIFYAGYRVQSTAPIVAYQFNPLDNVDVFSNDASLLIPATTFGTEYLVVSRFEFVGGAPDVPLGSTCESFCAQYDGGECVSDGIEDHCLFPYRGTINVIAKDPDTTVKVKVTARTQAGGQVLQMEPGIEYEYTMQPFQVLNIRSNTDAGDLTGSEITSNKPVGVFSGHQAALTNEECCADHLEQMMFPVNTWGKTYLATKSFPRGVELDYWVVLASVDGTVVQFEPAIAPNQGLDRGEFFEFATADDFKITATAPVMVAQLLASSHEVPPVTYCADLFDCGTNQFCSSGNECIDYCDGEWDSSCPGGFTCTCNPDGDLCYCAPVGDPAMILAAPVEQYRDEYIFLTPDAYVDDYINIIAPSTATVVLDTNTVPGNQFTAIPGTGHKVARLKVTDGVHSLTADQDVGVIVYGYDRDVSYGYAAGLNLSDL